MILNNEEVIDESVEDVEPIINVQETDIYTPNLYIFAAILLVVFLIVYAIVYAIKSKDDYIDERIDDNISDENDE